jgi:DUF4097 and DUF4098 domain-containing protein YvlB
MPKFATPGPIFARIELAGGSVRIEASDRADTVVEVRPTDAARDSDVQAAEQTRVDYANGNLSVRGPKPRGLSIFRSSGSVELVIGLPTGSRVDASVAAEVRGQGRLGDVKLETAGGDVWLEETGNLQLRSGAGEIAVARSVGHTDVTAGNGPIRIGAIDGTAAVSTANGSITLGEVTGEVRLKTASGDIAVDRALGGAAARTAYGNVRVGEVVRGAVDLETAYGELEIGVREGTAAWLDVKSGTGRVRVALDASDGPGQADQTVEIRARTAYGDIVVRRA